MAKKSGKYVCWAVIGGSFFAANYAAQHFWPLWTVTLAGAVFLGAVVTYLLATQPQ